MKKKIIMLLLLLFPINIFAYSNKIIVGGETIGIEVRSKGIYIVGFYDINNKNIGKESGFKKGDIIIAIDNQKIDNINSLQNIITEEKEYQFKVQRQGETIEINSPVILENNTYKTGLYIKDQINGIGTLSYIDPETRIFGSLGHEIIENSSLSKFNIKDGNIYKAEVTAIKKSTNGLTGEKNAIINKNAEIGDIKTNDIEGIFGHYHENLDKYETLEVGTKEEIKQGEAIIRTVLKNEQKEDYKINIINIDENNHNKNILFEITDEKLLKETGGIIQGMSGSPIIQNNKIIGAVNYVIINETKKGYGIFITSMLEEGDKINS